MKRLLFYSVFFGLLIVGCGIAGAKKVVGTLSVRADRLSGEAVSATQSALDAHHDDMANRQGEPVPRILFGNQNQAAPVVE